MSPWMALVWLWLLCAVITLVSGLVMVGVAWAVGARPKEARFHWGPSLVAFQALGLRWSFGPLSFGTALTFQTVNGEQGEEEEENTYTQLPLPRRLLAVVGTFLGMLLLALVCLPPGRALAEIGSGFGQMVNVLAARERTIAFFTLLETAGFWTALGVLSAKLTAFNLLPIPPMAGYRLLNEGWRAARPSASRSNLIPPWIAVALLLLFGGWLVGLYGGLRLLAEAHP